MRTTAASLAFAVALAACGQGDEAEPHHRARPAPPPPPPSPATKAECAAAGHGKLADPGYVPDTWAHDHAVAARAEAIEADCNRDQWPAPIARCIAGLADALDFERCGSLPLDADRNLTADLQRLTRLWLAPP